ncbi:MAG: hypothetical protein GEU87_01010 [Alphaproteobacteria bacterium]|nr:hypothetical protein [Alphaproteobacteria bacterium]
MHRLSASFVLGYHGCDATVARRLLNGHDFKPSSNDYDWLGHGVYFWEANPARGLEFARETQAMDPRSIRTPTVVGAVIDLGLCLDLTTSAGIQIVRDAYQNLVKITTEAKSSLPRNREDSLRRNLDCAVVNLVHEVRKNAGYPPIDTVRTVFTEGKPIYDGSGFLMKSHIQICVCNPACIKGVFRVRNETLT